jgi:pimeloyl-ACP methyl ester carboxylesterase
MAMQVLLVHGAWHGAWAWERVAPLLAAAGVDATAVDLPGHGGDAGPLGDLHDDAARVRRQLDRAGSDVVLVGHSYGGAVITEAGDHPAVSHLVYLAAFPVDFGESCATAAASEAAATLLSHEGRPDLGGGFIEGPAATVTLDPGVAEACLYNDCDAEIVAWALARLGPQPLRTLQDTPRTIAWRLKPSTYAVCANDMAVHPDLQRLLARRCSATVEWPTGHSPFLSLPELVADLLGELALARTGGAP